MEPIKKDVGCGHDERFRTSVEDGRLEFCTMCALDRGHKNFNAVLESREAYEALRETMDLHSPPGTKVVLWFPHAGYPGDVKQLKDLGMGLGQVFTVRETRVGGSHTTVLLQEFPGRFFNSVHFGVPTEADLNQEITDRKPK